nr:hypothetical protein [Cytophagales bacterium]
MTVNFCLIWQSILLLFFLAQPSRAQENTVTFRAKLVDNTTQQPVTGAHIRSRKQQAISNGDGFFEITFPPGTPLRISHVGYEAVVLDSVTEAADLQTIALIPVMVYLDEVTVTPLPSEVAFKQLMLETNVPLSREEVNMESNIAYMQRIRHLAYFHDMTSYNMLIGKMNTPGNVTLLSSNPSLGIIGIIKRLRQDRTVPGRSPRSDHIPSLLNAYRRKGGAYSWLFE